MKYALAIFPSKEIQDEANGYRKRYDPQFTKISPHITLKYRFNLDTLSENELKKELKQIAQQVDPFKINITKVSTFAPVTNTIYFKVVPNPELVKLHELMHTGKFPSKKPFPFTPHITIARDLHEDEYSDIYGSLQMLEVQFEDTIENFSLVRQLEDESWEVVETFPLKKE